MDAGSVTIVASGGARFWQHIEASIKLLISTSIQPMKTRAQWPRKNMWQDDNPLGGADSSNPCCWQGWQLCHHGGGVCCVIVLCVVVLSGHHHSLYVK